MKKIISLALLLGGLSFSGLAQTCRDKLSDAQIAYYNGQFKAVVDFLKPCVASFEIEKEKVEALELLSKSFLMLEQDSLASIYVGQILKIQNDYQASPSRSVSLSGLIEQFKLEQKWAFSFYAGPLFMDYHLIKNRSFSGQYAIEKSFEKNTASLFGLRSSYRLYKGLNVALKLEYLSFSFRNVQLQNGYKRLESEETYHYLQLPIVLAYELSFKKIQAFMEIAFVPQRLLAARGDIQLNPVEPENLVAFSGYPQSLSNFDLRFQNEPWRNNYQVGWGLRYALKSFSLELACSYQYSGANLINTDAMYKQTVLQNDLAYLPQDFSISFWRYSFGLTYIIKELKKRK